MKNILIFTCICCFMFWTGCKRDCNDPTNIECSNYDPCYEIEEVKASFTMVELASSIYWWADDIYIPRDVDTAILNNIVFTAPEGMDKYTWIIGTETLHERVITRHSFPEEVQIPITLIVERTPNTNCFPNDNGIDTLTRYLYVLSDHCKGFLPKGSFWGYHGNDIKDTSTVKITFCENYPSYISSQKLPSISGLIPNCDSSYVIAYEWVNTRRQLAFIADNRFGANLACDKPVGRIEVFNDSIFINYQLWGSDDREKWYSFTGKRIE